MRQMDDRPVLLQRFPNGAHGSNFFQKRIPEGAPDWLHTTIVQTPNGTTSRALVIADLAHLLWAVNIGCLGFHSWPTHAADLEHCDELRIDLDPGPGTNYGMAQETAAAATKQLFDELGIAGYIKTSGNRGLHVYVRLVPEHDSVVVRSAAVAIAPRARTAPPRPHHRIVVEGGARRAHLHRLQPERPAQDRVRPVVGAGARSCSGLVPVRVGDAADAASTRHDDRDRAGMGRAARRPVGSDGRVTRNRSSRSSRWSAPTRRPGCRMHRGRRCTRRWRASRRVSRRAAPRSRNPTSRRPRDER